MRIRNAYDIVLLRFSVTTLTRYGADSFVGRAASVCVGSTETIFTHWLCIAVPSASKPAVAFFLPLFAGFNGGAVSGILMFE